MNNMNDLNRFLKVMAKMGYPSPNTVLIAKSMDYDLDEFLIDLVDEVGEERTDEFVEDALSKLSEDGKGIRVPLNNNNYIYLHIYQSRIDLNETDNAVLVDWGWGENKLTGVDENGNEFDSTMDELYDYIGMGDWGEWDEMIDSIQDECYDYIKNNCGFGIWYDKQQ
jgi:hypothetical protein